MVLDLKVGQRGFHTEVNNSANNNNNGWFSGCDISIVSGLQLRVAVGNLLYKGISVNTPSQELSVRPDIYDISTATDLSIGLGFNLNNLSYDNVSFSVNAQDTSPRSVSFNNDGTKMYISGASSDSIHQYTLTEGFNLATATYDNVSLNVSSQDGTPDEVVFNDRGDKMFIIGNANMAVYQYSLTTFFDLSTASYDDVFLDVSTQESTPRGLAFNNNGRKMYIVGETNDTIFEYDLPNPFDLSNASYDDVFLDVSGQDGTPHEIYFNNDGRRMFIVGGGNDTVYQYDLTTGFDLSTASYNGISLDVSGQDTNPSGIFFNNNGTRMFIMGDSNDRIYQYSLSNSFNLNNLSYNNVSLDVSGQDGAVNDVYFNDDGTRMFIVGVNSGSVHQYSLTTGFDLSTASYDNVSFSVNTQATVPSGIAFDTNGRKMFVVDLSNNTVYEYDLDIGFDLSTDSDVRYSGNSFSVSGQDSSPRGVTFNDNGRKMYITGATSNRIFEYDLGNVFDLSNGNVTYNNVSLSVSGQDGTPNEVVFNTDGSRMFMIGNDNNTVYQYNLSTGFDLSTAIYTNISLDITGQETSPSGIFFSNDGSRMFISGSSSESIHQYTSPNLSSQLFEITDQETDPKDLFFNNDGSKMFIVGEDSNTVYQYSLTTAFDLNTASYDNVSFTFTAFNSINSINFNNDGTKMFVSNRTTNALYEFDLDSGFDLTNVTLVTLTNTFNTEVTTPGTLSFSFDGTMLFVSDNSTNIIYQYTLSTPFSLASVAYNNISFDASSLSNDIHSIRFNNNGNKMFLLSTNDNTIYQYTLTAPNNISTAVYDSISFSLTDIDTDVQALRFNNDGLILFLLGNENDSIYTLELNNDFDVGDRVDTVIYNGTNFEILEGVTGVNPKPINYDTNENVVLALINVANEQLVLINTNIRDMRVRSIISNINYAPIGSIIAWHEAITDPALTLPSNFELCDGTTVANTNSPIFGFTKPNLNGTTDDDKLFLKGVTGTTGGISGSSSHNHNNNSADGDFEEEDTDFEIQPSSHIPPYFEVVWIIRVL